VLTAAEGGGAYRDVNFEVWLDRPCWGLLNVTSDAGILSWSLTRDKWRRDTAPLTAAVRFTSAVPGGRLWQVSVRLAAGGGRAVEAPGAGAAALRLRLHVDYLDDTPNLRAMARRVPRWGTLTFAATGFVSEYVL
jgi:hypothetical protein